MDVFRIHASFQVLPLVFSLLSTSVQAQHRKTAPSRDSLEGATLRFEACSSKNAYLQNALTQAWQKSSKASKLELKDALDRQVTACVWAGMQFPLSGHKGNYLCDKANRPLKELANRGTPCVSRELVGVTATELEMASRCLGVNVREILPLLMHESRFQPNAVSMGSAGGTGQLTKWAIKEVNNNLSQLQKETRNKEGCESAREAFSAPMEATNTCARMMIPESPRKNLAYTVAYYRHIRNTAPNSASRLLENWLARQPASLTSEEKQQIIQEVTRAMYNGGITTIAAHLRTFLAAYPKAGSVATFQQEFRRAIGGDKTEYGRYAKKIEVEASLMNDKAKIRCSL